MDIDDLLQVYDDAVALANESDVARYMEVAHFEGIRAVIDAICKELDCLEDKTFLKSIIGDGPVFTRVEDAA